MQLNTIKPSKGSKKTSKRLGRGLGSGKGTYSGRGSKGQRSRSGGKSGLKLKGLRSIMLSLPKKRGFKSNKPKPEIVNLNVLAKVFADGDSVNPKMLLKKGLVKKVENGVKILGSGSIGIKITIEGCLVSKSVKEKIEKAGGQVK
ncbi:MAG: 50S ribosomal protein L15 [Patescibacteria group bacterium]